MDKNRKDPLYKGYLKAIKRKYQLQDIQRKSGWVKLKKPYKDGYIKYYDLRDDIKNREDSWIFYKCLWLVARNTVWSRDKKFLEKKHKGKYEVIEPSKGYISKKTYEDLHPKVKKYFYPVEKQHWVEYHCELSYHFVLKIKPRWVTEYKEHDSVIEKEIAEINAELETKYYKFYWGWLNSVGFYKTIRNRKDRAYNKSALRRNLKYEDYDKHEYRYQHKHSAKMDAW